MNYDDVSKNNLSSCNFAKENAAINNGDNNKNKDKDGEDEDEEDEEDDDEDEDEDEEDEEDEDEDEDEDEEDDDENINISIFKLKLFNGKDKTDKHIENTNNSLDLTSKVTITKFYNNQTNVCEFKTNEKTLVESTNKPNDKSTNEPNDKLNNELCTKFNNNLGFKSKNKLDNNTNQLKKKLINNFVKKKYYCNV